MKPSLFTVHQNGPGRLSTMARPRGGDWLDDEMSMLAVVGVDVLVSALTDDELRDLDLTREPDAARRAGLGFVSIPIQDRTVPDHTRALPPLKRLADQLCQGAHVVVHCRFGIGRASLLAVGLLVLTGVPGDAAWSALERARGLPVPDTPEQRAWPFGLVRG